MIKMSSQLETILSAYKTLSKIPSILEGKLLKASENGAKITSRWSTRNLDKAKSTKFLYNYVIDKNNKVIAESEFGIDISNEILSSVSPRENFKAVIREEKDTKDSKKQYLEVWRKNNLVRSVDLTALDIHGDVYADSEFGSLCWSHDESSLIYVAEKKLPKSEPYFKRKNDDQHKYVGSGETCPKRGEEYRYRQDWGEQLVGKHLSVVVIYQLVTDTCSILKGLPDSWCPGQVRFWPDSRGVVGVAWETEPTRLGLIFCTNRPSYIFKLGLDGSLVKVSAEGMAVRSPRFSSQGDLLWLQRPVGGPHNACHSLQSLKHGETEIKTVINIVEDEVKIANGDSFYGLYCSTLPERCFSDDGKRIIFSTQQQNEVRTYVADLDGGRIVDISLKSSPGSTSLFDVCNDVLLASVSSLINPTQLYVARLPTAGQESGMQWAKVSGTGDSFPPVTGSTVEYMTLSHDNSDAVKSFTAIYFAPKSEKKLPLVVWPHGGPHSGFVNTFSIEAALYNLLGFASIQINYRGSTGTGQSSIEFLPKQVGTADVLDCKLATEEAIKRFAIDEKRIGLTGGSHGGFLVAHLSGQYPDMYKAVVSRNPVIDVASMFFSSDIPDWCEVESGFEYSEKGPISEERMLAMRRCSPIVHAHKVKAATCLLLGKGDLRVPKSQGLAFARRLKAAGVPVRIYVYDDNHSLSSLPSEVDHLINGADWLLEYLKP